MRTEISEPTGHLRVRMRRWLLTGLAGLTVCGATATFQSGTAVAQADPVQELVDRYAPVVFVTPQDGPCDPKGEPFEPAPVEIVLDNPEVFLRQVGNDDPVAMRGPGGSDLFDLREGWYLEFPGDALRPGCIFEQDFDRFYDGQSVVYAHIAQEPDRPGFIAVQYWFWWYHNPAKNDHEGDWEFVQLLFRADSVEEAMVTEPVSIGYAQHTGGERRAWNDPKVEKVGVRPVVYPAVGSHASYFGKALYLGLSGNEGFGCDTTARSTRRIDPTIVLLPDQVTEPDDEFAWLAFQGRWGQREPGFFNGPTGPYAKWRWDQPVTWEDGLRQSSVVIPGGDTAGNSVVSTFCRSVEVGSDFLAFAFRSPTAAFVTLAVLGLVALVLTRRTKWSPVTTAPLVAGRAVGQIVRAALRIWGNHPLQMLWVGLVYIPVAIVSSLIQVGVQQLPFVAELVELAGDRSWVATFLAVFVGGLGNLLAYVYVSAAVASTLGRSDRSDWAREFSRPIGSEMLRTLLVAVAKSAVIVVALLVSIVGIPWGIRQLVRYQVAPQVIAIEGADATEALRRSSHLVSARWWWTAGVIASLQIIFGVAGFGTAVIVLLLTSFPLWLFNVVSSVIYVALVPVGAAAMTYVYGTLAARERDTQEPFEESGQLELITT